jgi:hypothetical protein
MTLVAVSPSAKEFSKTLTCKHEIIRKMKAGIIEIFSIN